MNGSTDELQTLHTRIASLEHQLRMLSATARDGSTCNCGGGDVPDIDPVNVDALFATSPVVLKSLVTSRTRLAADSSTSSDSSTSATGGRLAGQIFYLTVPAGKKMSFFVRHSAAYEVGVKITGNDTALYWRRNSYEADVGETEILAVNSERYFQFEGMFKRCWVLNRVCAQRPWNLCPSAAIVSESGNVSGTYETQLMWDDSRVPAQVANISATIKVYS